MNLIDLREWLQDPLNRAVFTQILDLMKWGFITFGIWLWRKTIRDWFRK